MLIKKEDSNKKENSKSCIVWEYKFGKENLDLAVAKIDGRYPETGRVVNTECDETYYVTAGSGTIHHESGDFEINPGDAFFFEKGDKYSVEGKDLTLVMSNSPAWYPEQHQNTD